MKNLNKKTDGYKEKDMRDIDKKYLIMAGFDGKHERVAMKCESMKEAENRLNKAFSKKGENLWMDNLGQEFSINEEVVKC